MNDRQITDTIVSAARVGLAAELWNLERPAEPGPSAGELQQLNEITGAPTIITDADLRILSISGGAGDLFGISQSCLGAPVSSISNLPELDGLIQDARLVLEGQQAFIERMVGKVAGEVLLSRMLPYHRTGG